MSVNNQDEFNNMFEQETKDLSIEAKYMMINELERMVLVLKE